MRNLYNFLRLRYQYWLWIRQMPYVINIPAQQFEWLIRVIAKFHNKILTRLNPSLIG
jgi:hypothetical protein